MRLAAHQNRNKFLFNLLVFLFKSNRVIQSDEWRKENKMQKYNIQEDILI